MISLTACGQQINTDTLTKIKQEKKIRVAYIPYFDLTKFNSDRPTGFLVEILDSFASRKQISKEQISFIQTDWANFISGLNQGLFDLSIAGTFDTEVRRASVDFTKPLCHLGNGALMRMDHPNISQYKSIQDFNTDNIKIVVVVGEQGYEYVKKTFDKIKTENLIVLYGADLTAACAYVENKIADVALSDQYILKTCTDVNPHLKDVLADNPYSVLPISWAVRKGDTSFLKDLNQFIEKDSNLLKQLRAKYNNIPFK